MKLKKISLLVAATLLITAVVVTLGSSAGMAQNIAPTVKVGPTAYLPGASPTSGPGISVGERNVSTPMPVAAPTVTVVPTVTAVPTTTMAPAPTAAQGAQATSAKIVNYGTDKDTFSRGDRATGFMTIQNTGNTPINDVTTSVSAKIALPIIGSTSVGNKDYTFRDLNIQPGETKRVEFTVDIPSEYMGVSTAGNYDLHVNVKTGDKDIGSFSKTVKVV